MSYSHKKITNTQCNEINFTTTNFCNHLADNKTTNESLAPALAFQSDHWPPLLVSWNGGGWVWNERGTRVRLDSISIAHYSPIMWPVDVLCPQQKDLTRENECNWCPFVKRLRGKNYNRSPNSKYRWSRTNEQNMFGKVAAPRELETCKGSNYRVGSLVLSKKWNNHEQSYFQQKCFPNLQFPENHRVQSGVSFFVLCQAMSKTHISTAVLPRKKWGSDMGNPRKIEKKTCWQYKNVDPNWRQFVSKL